jgi:hypothetical protein
MPRGNLTKSDMLARIYKIKTALYNGEYRHKNAGWHDGAHEALNKVLDILNEYSR